MSASVRLSARRDISETTRAIFTKFFVQVAYVCGSVVLQHIAYRREGIFFPIDSAL